ncbi:MAG: signal peptidase I [Bacteroidales bacterium]|nr:signal peptidase I [Bacteroidales bacterium]MBQ5783617.1 signal peptidase I [Bacteroidales bacterium]MBR6540475.1 signal peptidase I [Bacteroidales bacterium]
MNTDFLKNRWFKFALYGGLYLLWVIWLGNYWWLLGLAVIFDIYVTKKVKWAFWSRKSKNGKKSALVEWTDALVFAIVVATFIRIFFFEAYTIPTSSMEKTLRVGDYLFVSKIHYGPRVPQTPISFPLVHNVMPIFGGESYSQIISNDYRRLKGLSKVERDDIVVFGFPHGDTILKAAPMDDYYTHVRINGRAYTEKMYGPIVVRPNDKKDNYVKRCVAIAGDTLSVVNGKVIVNGIPQKDIEGIQNTYTVYTNGTTINPKVMQKLDINPDDYYYDSSLPGYPALPLTQEAYKQVVAMVNVVEVRQNIDVYPPEYPDSPIMLFPFSENYKWTRDNYGPIWIPKAGATTEINANNYHLYQRIITAYEGNTFEVKDGKIYINGQQSNTYTFKQDYYFMMGDNRHNSLDSRYWGFVPEDHIVGTPAIIWFSTDKNKSFPSNIRWNRLFNFI